MKKIGRTVLDIHANEANPRNGEGTFIRLKDGTILYAFTYYYDSGWDDDCTARIAGCFSSDEGETWSDVTTLFPKDEHAKNNMSPSLVRLPNGELGMLYLRKELHANGALTCMPVFRRSCDEGKTWSDWCFCGAPEGYYCGINDGAVCLRNGRILMPIASSGNGFQYLPGHIDLVYSDDNGHTWHHQADAVLPPFEEPAGLQEPGVYEYEDGTLWAWFRTAYGYQYQSFSEDGGQTWSPAVPNFHFTSPDAPMRVKKVGPYTIAVFNPIAYHYLRTEGERKRWGRTPLVCAVSRDDGRSFDSAGKNAAPGNMNDFAAQVYLLADKPQEGFCYPAIQETADGFLVAFYNSNGCEMILRDATLLKIRFSELEP